MNQLTARAVQGVARFLVYSTISALILLSPVLVGLLLGGDVTA